MTWPCDAYGSEAAEHGALCFAAPDLGQRVCGDPAECRALVAGERQRVYRRMQELAAAGDPVMAELAEEFTSPDRVLPGDEDEDAGDR